jgi:hypothetical protein
VRKPWAKGGSIYRNNPFLQDKAQSWSFVAGGFLVPLSYYHLICTKIPAYLHPITIGF